MTVSQALPTRKSADEILSAVKISNVCYELTRTKPRRSGQETYRAFATWRGGDGWSVSLDDERGLWHDFVTDEGGGILDLVVRIRGGTRQDALHWVAEFAGIPLDDKPFSPAERQAWAHHQEELEHDLPDARLWRRAAIDMAESVLCRLKARLFDPLPIPADLSESIELPGRHIYEMEQMLGRLRAMDGAELVAVYQEWERELPGLTWAMVRTAREREQIERAAVSRYIRSL